MKVIQKYFLALVPPVEILQEAHEIKLRLKEEFGIKYALKSPPHITLKMPFNYNESKEGQLAERLGEYLTEQRPFRVRISGVGTFGNRVIFLSVEKSDQLLQLQQGLKLFCKQKLHLTDELSDRNFHPHLTIAFKDLKAIHFLEVLSKVKENSMQAEYSAGGITLLKRLDGMWNLQREVPFGVDF